MEIKAAWRILDVAKGDKPERYYTRRANIYIDGKNTVSGKPLIIVNALVGLVGLHINVMTKDGEGSVWPTFEHIDNAPPVRGPNPPAVYSYYNSACTTCPVNAPPKLIGTEKDFKWSMTPPYAQRYANAGKYGTQVMITESIFGETSDANRRWHGKLGSSVWALYRVAGTQWTNHEVPKPAGIPPVLGNAVLETYIQKTSTCIGCHSQASLAASKSASADFSFLLGLAH
jgi:hypothetical protein